MILCWNFRYYRASSWISCEVWHCCGETLPAMETEKKREGVSPSSRCPFEFFRTEKSLSKEERSIWSSRGKASINEAHSESEVVKVQNNFEAKASEAWGLRVDIRHWQESKITLRNRFVDNMRYHIIDCEWIWKKHHRDFHLQSIHDSTPDLSKGNRVYATWS